MKIKDAIEKLRRIDDCQKISDGELVGWLSDLDILVNREILLPHKGCGNPWFCGYDSDVDQERELLVPSPYTDIYIHWLQAKVAAERKELEEYNVSNQLYNELRQGFADEINRRFTPRGTRLRLV